MTPHATSSPQSNDGHLDPGLLERYWLGAASVEERAAVQAWFAAHPEWQARYTELRTHLATGAWEDLSAERVNRLMAGALEAMQIPHVSSGSAAASRAPARRQGASLWWLGVTGIGVAVLLLVAGLRAFLQVDRMPQNARHTYATTTGEQLIITLPDSSRVTLAPQTTVHVPAAFGTETRTVSLVGQAYFEVAATSGTPFVVQTGSVATRVLGTAFDVRHYPTDSVARITVVSGKVTTGSARAAVTLTAGTMAHVTDSTATPMPVRDMQMYTAWTEGRLVFRDVPASAMLTTLGRWYGYEFRLADSALASRHVTATFDAKSHEEAMVIVKYVLGVTMTFQGDTVVLHPRRERIDPNNVPKRRGSSEFSLPTGVGK